MWLVYLDLASRIEEDIAERMADPVMPGWEPCRVCGRLPLKEDLVLEEDPEHPGKMVFVMKCRCNRTLKGPFHKVCDRWNDGSDLLDRKGKCRNPYCPFPNPVSGGKGTYMGKYGTMYRCTTCERRWVE